MYSKGIVLKDVLKIELMLDDMTCKSKKAAIEELVDVLSKSKLIENKKEVIDRILERESLVSTALGNYIAIPHARIDVGEKPLIVIGRHKAGVDFESPDGEPVKFIFLVLWAPKNAGLFNRLFAGLVTKLADAEFRKCLDDAKDAKAIAALFENVKVDMAAGRSTKCDTDMLVTLQLLEAKRRAGARGLKRQIELARNELPGSILSRFDKLADHFGDALVDAPNGICTGCNMQLSSSFAYEILKNPETLYLCEKCGRFLVHEIS